MSTPQNPYEPNSGSGNQNPNGQDPDNQPPSAPGFSDDQNNGQQPPQYGSQNNGQQPPQYGSQNDPNQQPPQYGSQPQYGQPNDPNQQPQYGSQPQYGQPNDTGAPSYDQNQGGYGQGYDPNGQGYDPNAQGYDPNGQGYNQDPYSQNQGGYGQGYDPNAQGYDANQYGQQPAYAGAEGSSDQFIPANPNASYGSYSAGPGSNKSKNIWGILALVGGIAGIVLSFVFGIGFIFGVAGVIFAFVGLSAIKKGLANNKGMTITGMILSFVAILFSIISLVVTLIFGGMFITAIGEAADEQSSSAAPVQGPSGPAQDPSQGAGSSDGSEEAAPPPVEDGGVEIGTDLTAAVALKPGTANDYASGAENTNGEIAIVTVTVKNSGSSDIDLGLARMTADNGAGKDYKDVFDSSSYAGGYPFEDPIPAGGEKTVTLAFAVPSAEVDKVHLKLSLIDDLGKGKDFEFSKAA